MQKSQVRPSWHLHLLVGIYFVLLVAGFTDWALGPDNGFVDLVIGWPEPWPGLILLLGGVLIVGLAHLESVKTWRVLSFFCSFATILSFFYVNPAHLPTSFNPTSCYVIYLGHGFPLSYYYVVFVHLNSQGPLCHLPIIESPRIFPIAMLEDALFYLAAGLGIIETTKGTRTLLANHAHSSTLLSSLPETKDLLTTVG